MFQKILIALLLLASSIQAQEINAYWGKEFPYKLKDRHNILGRRGDVIIGYKQSSNGQLSLLKYSINDLRLIGEVPFTNLDIGVDYTFERFILLKDRNYVVVSNYDRRTNLNVCYAREFDNDGRLKDSLITLGSVSGKVRNNGSFMVYLNLDSTQFVLLTNPPYQKYEGEKFGFRVFNSNAQLLSESAIKLPYKDKNFQTTNVLFSNTGMIHMLAKIEKEKDQRNNNQSRYYYEIITIDPVKQTHVEFDVSLPDKEILDASFNLTQNGEIICGGFYNVIEDIGRDRDEINGIFYLRINAQNEIAAKEIKELEKSFIEDLESRRKAEKGRGLSGSFRIKQFVDKHDGGGIIIAENAYDYVTTYTSSGANGIPTIYTDYHYVRNNIIAINLAADGSIKWLTNIPKYQHTINDNGLYSSFAFKRSGDLNYFIYNDNAANLQNTAQKSFAYPMERIKNSVAVIVVLNEEGAFSKKALFSNKENKTFLMPARYANINNNEQIIFTVRPGSYFLLIPFRKSTARLVRFEFK